MAERRYRRFDRNQLRQHQVLMTSTFLLIATGLPLKFASSRTSQTLAQYLGGASMAALFHRIGAIGLMVVCVWHLLYLATRIRRKSLSYSMIPTLQDVRDAIHQILYLVGARAEEPRYDRFNFLEKFEYWAMVWGSVVMLASGFVLWFPVQAADLVTGMGIQLAKVVHGYEALLAALSILLWHMYHAHLRADIFPMNRVWLTGELSEEEMRHHHPLELERILAAQETRADEGATSTAAPAPLTTETTGSAAAVPTATTAGEVEAATASDATHDAARAAAPTAMEVGRTDDDVDEAAPAGPDDTDADAGGGPAGSVQPTD